MPNYEYKCKKCNEISEFTMKLKDPHPSRCPQCSHPELSRLISQTSFSLKGDGWYSDLYSSSSPKPQDSKTKPSSPPQGTETKKTPPKDSTPSKTSPSPKSDS